MGSQVKNKNLKKKTLPKFLYIGPQFKNKNLKKKTLPKYLYFGPQFNIAFFEEFFHLQIVIINYSRIFFHLFIFSYFFFVNHTLLLTSMKEKTTPPLYSTVGTPL